MWEKGISAELPWECLWACSQLLIEVREAPWKPEDDPASSGAAVVVIGEQHNAGAGNSTWVLYKSSSEESPLRHLHLLKNIHSCTPNATAQHLIQKGNLHCCQAGEGSLLVTL